MSDIESLHNIIRQQVQRAMAQWSPQSRVGTVSSYDKKTHSVKVMLQPENRESNWIPIAVQHTGNGFGILVGPKIGDQLEIGFHQNDPSTARVIGRYHSEKEKPPQVESGEMLLKHESGSTIFFDKNGNIRINAQGELRIKAGGGVKFNSGTNIDINSGDDDVAPSPTYDGGAVS